jgi:hypothetical protein
MKPFHTIADTHKEIIEGGSLWDRNIGFGQCKFIII